MDTAAWWFLQEDQDTAMTSFDQNKETQLINGEL